MSPGNIHYDKALFLDLELTCWGPGIDPPFGMKSEIIQVGIVETDLVDLKITRDAVYYVKPNNYEISDFCTSLTGITAQDIKLKGRPFYEICNRITKDFGPKNKITYAWGSDNDCIVETCDRVHIKNPWGKMGIWDLGLIFRSSFLLKRRFNLEYALEYLGLDFEGKAHDAKVDARNTARLHLEMVRRMRGTIK